MSQREVCADSDHPQKMRCYVEEHLDWSVKMAKPKGFPEALVGESEGASILEPGTAPLGGDRLGVPSIALSGTIQRGTTSGISGKGER